MTQHDKEITAFCCGGLVLILILLFWAGFSKAQTVVPPITIQSAIPHTSCALSVIGVTNYCFASDGLWVSTNGGNYVLLSGGGVTSITVCNAGGTSCGLPLSGTVSLNVPKTVTASAPTVTLQ